MKKIVIIGIIGIILIFVSCDPNEPEVPDSADFIVCILELDSTSNHIVVDVYFADDYGGGMFRLYINHERSSGGGANFMVRCKSDNFIVYEESSTNSGWFNQVKYDGVNNGNPPVISGTHYQFSFPLSAIEPTFDPDFTFGYWLYEPSSGDRYPDTGEEVYTIIG